MGLGEPTLVVASAARTTTGNSAALTPGHVGESLALLLDITAVAGTPNLVLSVEWSNDATNWAVPEVADAFAAVTTAVKRVKVFERKAMFYRVVWTITGTTPSFTFSVWEYLSA
jgi:hypothetical protein